MVVHTVQVFAQVSRIARGLLVLAPEDQQMRDVLQAYPQSLFDVAYVGGASRAESVLAGLRELRRQGAQDADWVLVHDAARCLLTPAQVNALIDACQDDAVGGLLALKLADTLKQEVDGRVGKTVDRADKWLAQTPQMFGLKRLHDAIEEGIRLEADITDEASAMELSGSSPLLIEGATRNFKVTHPADWDLMQTILQATCK